MSYELMALDPENGYGIIRFSIETEQSDIKYFLVKPPHFEDDWTEITKHELSKLIYSCSVAPKTKLIGEKSLITKKIKEIYTKYHIQKKKEMNTSSDLCKVSQPDFGEMLLSLPKEYKQTEKLLLMIEEQFSEFIRYINCSEKTNSLLQIAHIAFKEDFFNLLNKIFNILDDCNLNDSNKIEFEKLFDEYEKKIENNKRYHISDATKIQLLKYVIWKNDELNGIRGEGNIEKITYAIKKDFVIASCYLSYEPAPSSFGSIIIPEVHYLFNQFLDNKLLEKKDRFGYILSKKGKRIWENEINEFENIIVKKVSKEFLNKIQNEVKEIGKMTSEELKEWENKRFRKNSKNYHEKLI